MKIKIKYFDNARRLELNPLGNLVDVYANEDVFVPYMSYVAVKLGFAMEIPKGYIAKIYARSSTFKTWGCIQPNHVGIIDDSYCGDNDQWHFTLQCTQPRQVVKTEVYGHEVTIAGTWIKKGDKIGQFEIVKATELDFYEFEEVNTLNNPDRGGFGTSGSR